MNKAARFLAVGTAVAALTLTGCAGSPSAAALVDGVAVPDSTVRATSRVLVSLSGAESDVALKQATYDLLLGEASRQIAASTGTEVSQVEKDDIISQSELAAALAATPEGSAWADAVGTTYVLLEKLGETDYVAQLNELDIVVNPRYGVWNAAKVTFTDASLSTASSSNTLGG